MSEKKTGLALLREPFPPHQISKLPKPTKSREEMAKIPKAMCKICGNYHATTNVIHLDYVGHAALTDRLLDADPKWNWEPLSCGPTGQPVMDEIGGMWIKLTVCDVTRLGYGNAGQKEGGDAIKEIIGDALRNAAMRFGAALELWHKGELHEEEKKTISPSDGCFAALSEEDQNKATDAAMTIVERFDEGKEIAAYEQYYQAGFSNEIRLGIWELLKPHSKIRASLKAMHEQTNKGA